MATTSIGDRLANGALLAAVVLLAVGLARLGPRRSPGATHVSGSRLVVGWTRVADAGRRIGRANSPVTITEFSDYQCPGCARTSDMLRALDARHRGRISISIRHLPLEQLHPVALAAAEAAECAAESGRFEVYHHELFARQAQLPRRPWFEVALAVGIADTATFSRCLREEWPLGRIRRDIQDARALGLTGTPSLMVNDRLYAVGTEWSIIETYVDSALRAAGGR
jgi:protein-disulfide isomerase